MTPEDKAALIEKRSKDERVLIYKALLNGVPVWRVTETFRRSDKEVMDIFRFVSRMITEYCFERKMPLPACDAIAVAQKYRRALLSLLTKVNLDKQPAFGKILNEKVNPGNAMNVLGEMAMRG